MRKLPVAAILALASLAVADPAPRTSWADWVGDWEGKLKWTSCVSEGHPKAAISIDATDGALGIDLTAAGGALGKLSLVEDEAGGFSAQQGDVTVSVRRTKDLELIVTLDSGCEVRGTLARKSVGIATCDRLAAWARIESQCKKLARPPLENPARLARQRAKWLEARGEARTKLASQCTSRAARVEAELVDVGCAPNPDPAIGLRGAECQALRGISARLSRCPAVPFESSCCSPLRKVPIKHHFPSSMASASKRARSSTRLPNKLAARRSLLPRQPRWHSRCLRR
jgi:hypothetical protein